MSPTRIMLAAGTGIAALAIAASIIIVAATSPEPVPVLPVRTKPTEPAAVTECRIIVAGWADETIAVMQGLRGPGQLFPDSDALGHPYNEIADEIFNDLVFIAVPYEFPKEAEEAFIRANRVIDQRCRALG